ncbi:3-oxoacid CoA-transferase subunit B [Microvirga sp. BT350]|uniref:3-oxoacid CoA-transferase subunit B n=2 Tax=Microvirga alba TaxID=2791025 RepID=A0A931FNA8_9HYPH|nr:3-oxoacid CoA-transferase subunit B [Microvirga alba]
MTGPGLDGRKAIARLIARDIPEGWHVNLGIGIPTLVGDLVPEGREVLFQSENGILGMGPAPDETLADPWLVNAGKQNVTLLPGASLFDHALSFTMIRGGHLDLCVLGALEVAENGDLANWSTSASDTAPAVGGAMDLAVGARRIWVAMEHTTKQGVSKLVRHCSYPLTASGVVKRIYTNLAVIDVTARGFEVIELIADVDFETVQARTDAKLHRKDVAG